MSEDVEETTDTVTLSATDELLLESAENLDSLADQILGATAPLSVGALSSLASLLNQIATSLRGPTPA